MVKMNSISGLYFKVKDLDKTEEFYKKLGFTVAHKEEGLVTIRLNWFWINFIVNSRAPGVRDETLYISVDNVDETYKELVAQGFEFTAEPQSYPSGKREAMLADPDGYWLVFFQKVK